MRLKALRALPITMCLAAAFACADQPESELQLTGATAAAATSETILAAGDIAGCREEYKDEATARMVADLPGTVLLLGDVVYQNGTRWQFRHCYHPSWGRLFSRSRPAPGNHEYRTNEAAPYYEYFGSRAGPRGKGYYTFTLGSWRIYSLNSERLIDEQKIWLRRDLRRNPSKCVLAFWHKPLYTSGPVPPTPQVRPLFHELYRAGAEVVLNGHQHSYERFAPQDADSNYRKRGVRQFVVGTGGSQLESSATVAKNSRVRWLEGWGVLQMTLGPEKYSWKFLPLRGGAPPDSGSARCI
jgi:acid phosphatase type 7